jgi:tripartite tricarboxylate transporter family receptor
VAKYPAETKSQGANLLQSAVVCMRGYTCRVSAVPASRPLARKLRYRAAWPHQAAERLGQPFVVEHRPGAATNIATEAVVRAPPGGYTLLHFGSAGAINATLAARLALQKTGRPKK